MLSRPKVLGASVLWSFIACVFIIQRHVLLSERKGTHISPAATTKSCAHQDVQESKPIGPIPNCKRQFTSNNNLRCKSEWDINGNDGFEVNTYPIDLMTLEYVHGGDLDPGGMYHPPGCAPIQRVAVIVPYQDRAEHLKVFLHNIHPFLKGQGIQYMIFVVEQSFGASFTRLNRGMLRNIGFVEANKICRFDCFIFHDIDLLPEVVSNKYTCDVIPRHHAANLDRWNNMLPYPGLFGGVVSFRRGVFAEVNGYSNAYFGWGGEDDDLYWRVIRHNYTIIRYPMRVSKYTDLLHTKHVKEPSRWKYYGSREARMSADGLNSLKYTRHLLEFRKLYTWVYVEINEEEILGSLNIKSPETPLETEDQTD